MCADPPPVGPVLSADNSSGARPRRTELLVPRSPAFRKNWVSARTRAVGEQTTVSMQWIAERLRMRSAANVSQILRRNRAEPFAKSGERRSYVKIC